MVSGKKYKRVTVVLLAENAPGETGSGELEQQPPPFVELPVVCRGQQAPLQGGTAAIIRIGDMAKDSIGSP